MRALTLLVFGICMHSEGGSGGDTEPGQSFMVPNFWFQTEAAESRAGINWATILFGCRYDADGGGYGARGIFPVAVPDNRQGGTL